MPPATSYDVIVAGAGPAGSACATLLAREDTRVLLVDNGAVRERPAEVFAPATLRLIRQLELSYPESQQGARVCRGVLSIWGVPTEEFYDYELYECGAALAVDRHAYDRSLISGAQRAGADVLCGRLRQSELRPTGWHVVVGDARVEARLLVDATGRNGRAVPAKMAARCVRDHLVSFTFTHHAELDEDVLLLEAVRDGWWYASRHGGGVSSLVYLSDSDLVPRNKGARAEHFRRAFAATRLVRRHFPAAPAFERHRGHDARTAGLRSTAGAAWLAIGDAGFSSDPLSGEGTRLALESAQRAAAATLEFLRDGRRSALEDFSAWCDDVQARHLKQRQLAYGAVDSAFRGETFWRRRI